MIPLYESYAEALYAASEKFSETETVAHELAAIEKVFDKCGAYLTSPIISAKEKSDALRDVLCRELSPLTLEFVLLMAGRRHLKHFKQVAEKFLQLSGYGATVVNLQVPFALEENVLELLTKRLEEMELIPQKTSGVKLKIVEDKELIGGFKAYCNGYRIDTSLRTALEKLRRSERLVKSYD